MGRSLLEAAKLEIPSVITQIYPEKNFGDNNYSWLFNARGYELGIKEIILLSSMAKFVI